MRFFLAALCLLVLSCQTAHADPLSDAIQHGDVAGVKKALAAKPDLDPECGAIEICKPLAYAAEWGNVEIVGLLLDAGADPNGKNAYGDTAFMTTENAFALQHGSEAEITERNRAIQKLLLEKGADPNQENSDGATAFMGSAMMDDTEMMELALKLGAKVDHANAHGWTALFAAAQFNKAKAASWLLAHGADASLKDDKGLTPYDTAVKFGSKDVAEVLQGKGAKSSP